MKKRIGITAALAALALLLLAGIRAKKHTGRAKRI
jgi:uncharacterized protein (UPF0332 family)